MLNSSILHVEHYNAKTNYYVYKFDPEISKISKTNY